MEAQRSFEEALMPEGLVNEEVAEAGRFPTCELTSVGPKSLFRLLRQPARKQRLVSSCLWWTLQYGPLQLVDGYKRFPSAGACLGSPPNFTYEWCPSAMAL